MGWTFGCTSKAQVREEILRDFTFHSDGIVAKVIAHRTVGNHLWLAWERRRDGSEPTRCIVLCLLRKRSGVWGYKDMDESAGPYYYDCPLSLLALFPPPTSSADCWRHKVREHHEEAVSRKRARA